LVSGTSRVEISTVYLRTGYTSENYSGKIDFETRGYLEQTRAIKCPTIPLQLAGGKKVQEVLTQPGVLEHFLANEARWPGPSFTADELAEMRETWMGMWSLDVNDNAISASSGSAEPLGVRRAREEALNLVLKPQRDGGGNNVYKSNIPAFLDSLAPEEREGWIAMELILPPPGAGNYLVRAGGAHEGIIKADVISELGVFGWSLFGSEEKDAEETVGWLLRTKSKDSDEGGVAAGFSVLDSVVLVDD
jgi:glutathione synthase